MAAENGLHDREQLLDDVVAAYLEAVETQGAQDAQAWLGRYPELAGELAEFFADENQFGSLMAPLRDAAHSSGAVRTVALGVPTPPGGTSVAGLPPPVSLGEYEILEEIARGGMGVVFKARQRRLQRPVALKMILAGDLAAPTAVQRFRFEAEAIASLDHPHIVPIYDIGEDQNRHYFTMKLIEGASLTQHVARLNRDPDGAASLLATVARAVDYAHQRGLLHRDLKPANILLDEHGQPHVTDFGLAKWVNRGQSLQTEPGIAVGTPSYMAPEQAVGPHQALTTAADVYSLGAMLYELLTGRPPFKAETPLLTLRAVLDTEPPPPRSLNPLAPVDLEIVALKCLQKDPARRYASAAALADDLDRYLRREPIQARPVRTPERFWRWCRRKPIVAGLAAALLVSLVVGGGLATWQWQVAEDNLRQSEEHLKEVERQRQLAANHARDADDNFRRAEKHLEDAEKARLQAGASFKQAHRVVGDLIIRVGEQRLRDVPGLQPLRKELLEDALRYYEEFLKQRGDDRGLREELATTYYRIGDITNHIGPREKALTAYRRAQELFRDLLREQPGNAKLQIRLADAYINGSLVCQSLNLPPAALEQSEQACALLEPLCADANHAAEAKKALAVAYTNRGGLLRTLGRLEDSTAAFEKTHALLLELLKDNPKAIHLEADLAVCHANLGVLYAARGDDRQALASYELARSIQERLAKAQPKNLRLQYDLMLNQRRIGDRLMSQGRVADGVKLLRECEQFWRDLAKQNPSMPEYRSHLAACLRSLGHAERNQGRPETALPLYLVSRDYAEEVARAHGTVADYQSELAQSCYSLALTFRDLKERPQALEAFDQSVRVREQMLQVNPDNLDTRSAHAVTLREMANVLADVGRIDDSLLALEQAVGHGRVAVERGPLVAGRCGHLHAHYNTWAKVLRLAKRPEDAVRRVQESAAFFADLAKQHPEAVSLQRELAASWKHLAEAHLAAKDTDNGLKLMNQATALRRRLVQQHPDDWRLRNDLALSYNTLSTRHYGMKQLAEALRCYELARQHQQRVVGVLSDSVDMRDDMAMVLNNLGITLSHVGQAGAGAERVRQAIAYQERNLATAPKSPRFRNAMNVHYTALTEALRKSGQLAESVAAARKRLEYVAGGPADLFRAATEVARVVPLVSEGKQALSEEEQAQRKDFADQAMELLRTAVARGYRDGGQLRSNALLEPLRQRADFQELVKSVGK